MHKFMFTTALILIINLVFSNPVDNAKKGNLAEMIESSHSLVNNEIACLTGTYQGTWGGYPIVLEIIDARYNNFLSLRGTISGIIKYKNKVYPVKGSLRYIASEKRYGVNISMIEYDSQNKISFDFSGYMLCYQDGGGCFQGTIITPGYSHPEMNDITLKKFFSRKS